ncbi:HisA/HisF-related TIM barrel protein [Methanosphaerula palustris]|uniref:Histidine biosynthesis protein n=1 Tax=Methanosphaerula palustris (strain ATCC BAA-1556 / DSM 19958 / E1-9c) TaxID=521011 RepID=B8GDL0_METPE|nr:HisA/HisF-related TIM barrel protein [Methanosphaerula palustris]ACL17361.1 histidine biosynthesis protein [Methanosphaerula palustris E1-9c]
MELILAVDLKDGLVVHGKSGRRDQYAPLTWGPAPTAEPVGFVRTLRPAYLYIADLDRIEGRGDHDREVKDCAPLVKHCYLDRGCRGPEDYLQVPGVSTIVGTETGGADLERYHGGYLSLDIRDGGVIPTGTDPVSFLAAAGRYSFDGCILLNIQAVGTETGLDRDRLARLREACTGRLFYGGGVKGEEDLDALQETGFDGAIVATAVHKGIIPLDAVRRGQWS